MHKRVFGILEYDKILLMLKGHAVSDPGGQAALELCPSEEPATVKRLLQETAEAESMLLKQPSLPISAFSDIRMELKRLKTGASLNCAELLRVAITMKAAKKASQNITRDEENHILYDMAEGLYYSEETIRRIDTAIISEDEVSDDASGALRDIRRRILRENESIREKLNDLIRDATSAKYMQDALITVRQGRFVVPVKQEHKGAVKGIVHDQSASGQTLFIEPMAVVEANNRLRMLESEEKAEIERILAQISEEVKPYADDLENDIGILTYIDLVFAKASLARAMRAVQPHICEGILDIREGRHPLIDPAKVVPVSVRLGETFRGLIITGPNTGGKTVTLKLCGLMQLMAQSGLFVPATLGTRLPVYQKIFADIGDEQSIEQSLSTFSSHMRNITGILRYADRRSLVLLDELGAGTDPAEGAALAMSILEELQEKGAAVLATTHYSEIKAFALSSDFYENAGMEFDVESLSPTYRLFIGIPGLSNAFRISEKLGLRKSIIERAKNHMSEESIRFSEILTEAEEQREKAQKERSEAETLKTKTLELSEKLTNDEKKVEEKKEEILRKAKEEALEIIRSARDEAEAVIGELKKTKIQAPADVTRASESTRKRLKTRMESLQDGLRQKRAESRIRAEDLLPGSSVQILSLNTKATVVSLPDARGNVEVMAGMMKLTVKLNDLELAEVIPKKVLRQKNSVQLVAKPIAMEIDLRGMALDEALIELDKYLDDAFLGGLTEVCVIHGKGTGVLRQGIWDFLRHHPHAGKFRNGNFGEGEMGVTIVSLK